MNAVLASLTGPLLLLWSWLVRGFAAIVASEAVVVDWKHVLTVNPSTNVTGVDLTSFIGSTGDLKQPGVYVTLISVGATPNNGLGESRFAWRNGLGATDVSVTPAANGFGSMVPIPENCRWDQVIDIRNPVLYHGCKAGQLPELTVIVSSRPIGDVSTTL